MNNEGKVAHHTEDDVYHLGSKSKQTPRATACAAILIDGQTAVKNGWLFFNSSMHGAIKNRFEKLTKGGATERTRYWRREISDARVKYLEYNRSRHAARAARKKAKTA